MSSYNQVLLIERLNKLTDTQESIQTLSHWINFHKKHAVSIAETWHHEFEKGPPSKKLTLLYLVNDVLQHSRKRGGEFTEAFRDCITEAVVSAYHSGNETIQNAIRRLIQIWSDRKVFPADILDLIKNRLTFDMGNTKPPSEIPESNSLSSLMSSVNNLTEETQHFEHHMETVVDPLLNHIRNLDMNQRSSYIKSIQMEWNELCTYENKLKLKHTQRTFLCHCLLQDYRKHHDLLLEDERSLEECRKRQINLQSFLMDSEKKDTYGIFEGGKNAFSSMMSGQEDDDAYMPEEDYTNAQATDIF